MIRRYHPDALIDNRLEGSGEGQGSLVTDTPSEYAGDFACPEQIIPPSGLRRPNGEPIIWEACITMNNNWGFTQKDKNFKPPEMIIKKLVECVSKGGNMLLNVGPDAMGRIPDESLHIMSVVGAWMKKNGDAVYGCGMTEMEKPEFGRITKKGNTIYLHVMENQIGMIALSGIKKEQIKRMWMVATGAEVKTHYDWLVYSFPNHIFISFGESPVLPDTVNTVVAIELKEEIK
jgi:alpha-L-fucosidase